MLPKGERITKSREIKEIVRKKQFHHSSPLLQLIAADQKKEKPRLAVICSARLGKAVLRNKIRRRIMAAMRNIWYNNNKNCDVVIIPRSAKLLGRDLEQCLEKSIQRLGH